MIAEILCVGTELLLGDIVNTNSSWLAKELADLGVSVYRHIVIGDNKQRLKEAFETALNRSDVILCTGGLGPTQDDISKEALAEACGRKLVRNEQAAQWIKSRYIDKGFALTENNWRQANFPEGATPLFNPFGTAPGCQLELAEKVIFLMPGPPVEMKPMFAGYIKPWIQARNHIVLKSRVLRITGLGESAAEDRVADIVASQNNPTIAPYAQYGEVIFRITARADSEQQALNLIEPVELEMRKRFGLNIYGADDACLEGVVVELLEKNLLTISCAESCTGGLVTARLVNIPGVSTVLKEGIVAYSNEAKITRLNVNPETIKKFGAVSAEVAAEMAEGIAQTSNSSLGISTTGIAGPEGGTLEKPVGLVYIGLFFKGKVSTKELKLFNRSRDNIRKRATLAVLDLVRRTILG